MDLTKQVWYTNQQMDGHEQHGTPVSSTNKTDHYDVTEILLKVALNTITTTITKIMLKAAE